MKQIENKTKLMTIHHAHDPYVACPKCSHQIALTESLAAPLLEAERRAFRDQLTAKDAEFFKKSEGLRKQQEELNRARDAIEDQIKQRLQTERTEIVAAEARAAREAVAADLAASGADPQHHSGSGAKIMAIRSNFRTHFL